MERLRRLVGKKQNSVDFIGDMISLLLSGDLYADEILFRDAVEEIYRILRSEVIENGRKDLAGAYEKAVILKTVVSGSIESPDKLLLEIKKNLTR